AGWEQARGPGLAYERIGEGKHHGDTDTDQEGRIDQASQQKHFGLQSIHQLGLASRSFDVFATHQGDADTGADGAQTNNDAASQCNHSDVSHENSLRYSQSQKNKTRILRNLPHHPIRINVLHAPGRYTPASAS